jgi:mannitol-1-phosphate/altronate dehydrogenase
MGGVRRFPGGRPRWEDAGAQLVDDVEPFEQRKLWLLNGSHSMLAYAGSVRGHETIDEAIADPACREWVELFWDEASRHLPFPPGVVADYRAALLTRFSNPHAGPARPHRRRWLNQTCGSHHPNGPRGASRGPGPGRM